MSKKISWWDKFKVNFDKGTSESIKVLQKTSGKPQNFAKFLVDGADNIYKHFKKINKK